MARFRVMEEKGFFDGLRLHEQYAEIDIPPEKYKAWIGKTMQPLDKEAADAQAVMRKHGAKLKAYTRAANKAAREGDEIPDPPEHPFEPKPPEMPAADAPKGKPDEGAPKTAGKPTRASDS